MVMWVMWAGLSLPSAWASPAASISLALASSVLPQASAMTSYQLALLPPRFWELLSPVVAIMASGLMDFLLLCLFLQVVLAVIAGGWLIAGPVRGPVWRSAGSGFWKRLVGLGRTGCADGYAGALERKYAGHALALHLHLVGQDGHDAVPAWQHGPLEVAGSIRSDEVGGFSGHDGCHTLARVVDSRRSRGRRRGGLVDSDQLLQARHIAVGQGLDMLKLPHIGHGCLHAHHAGTRGLHLRSNAVQAIHLSHAGSNLLVDPH